jgi:subtilisin family serine protease
VQVPREWAAGHTGSGVVVGIVSTGIDLNHMDFKTDATHTRIKYVWDHTIVGGTGIPAYYPKFYYGFEYTQAQINAGQCPTVDLVNVGTSIAGVACGNGNATGNGRPANRYVGVAKNADIIIVRLYGGAVGTGQTGDAYEDDKVIHAVDYVFTKAAELGEPAVVLLGSTNCKWSHDGTSYLDSALTALSGPGKLIVAPTGNRGGKFWHAHDNVAVGGTSSLVFNYPSGPANNLNIEAWHEPTATFLARLTGPNGATTGWKYPGQDTTLIDTPDGSIALVNDQVTNAKGAKRINWFAWNSGGHAVTPGPANWTLELQRQASATTGEYDAWVSSNWTATSPSFTTHADTTKLIGSPATAAGVIGVSAYTTKNAWTYGTSNLPTYYAENPPVGGIYRVASSGPSRDGLAIKPDLAAPGQGIVSSLSSQLSGGLLAQFIMDDGKHAIYRGSEYAAAHVAGMLAIMLQVNPGLTPTMARAMLQSYAAQDLYTGAVPNATWGYGKLRSSPCQ